MKAFCLDLEGVLVPEIWIHVAKKYKLDSLKLTTRDIPNYDHLMKYRIRILKKENIQLCNIQKVISTMQPLPGALSFLTALRKQGPVIILSDTFYEFAGPLIQKLGYPALFCNWLRVDRQGFIAGYVLRQKDGKKKAVKALKQVGFQVKAAGDSYNDLSMLREANEAMLFRPPASIAKANSKMPVTKDYSTLLKFLCR